MAAHGAVGRARDEMNLGMELGDECAQSIVNRLGGQALVAPAIDADGGVIANFEQVVAGVVEEELVVVGIGAVPRIGEPEVLPDDDAVAICGVVEELVVGLADPVTNHVEVLVSVEAHGDVVLAGTVAQHGLREAPVATARNESPAVDPDAQ